MNNLTFFIDTFDIVYCLPYTKSYALDNNLIFGKEKKKNNISIHRLLISITVIRLPKKARKKINIIWKACKDEDRIR